MPNETGEPRASSPGVSIPCPRAPLDVLRSGLPGRRSLAPHEIQQVAYHVAASAVGDPIASPQRLAAAAQTMHEVRTLLKHGRGNVDADTEASQRHNLIGSSVAASGADVAAQVALAAAMGAAVCDEHAAMSAVMHAPYMGESDTVARQTAEVILDSIDWDGRVVSSGQSHAWAEWAGAGGSDATSTVVMDAWANGPAVRLKDSAWARAWPQADMSLDREGALQLKGRVEQLVPSIHPDKDAHTASLLARKSQAPTVWPRLVEAQVVSEGFAQKARQALAALPAGEQAALVAKSATGTYGVSESRASSPRAVQAVLQEAHRLDQQERPPIKPFGS